MVTNNDKNDSVQTSSCCKDLHLLISDHVCSNMKFSLVFEYFLEHTYIYLYSFFPPLDSSAKFQSAGTSQIGVQQAFHIFLFYFADEVWLSWLL